MRLNTRLPFALLIVCASQAYAQSSAPITGVVLYPGSATIERAVQVAAGARLVEVQGVPANFDVQTMRAQGDAGIQIGQIVVRDISATEAASARETEIQNKIQALQDKVDLIDVDAKSAELAKGYLERLSGAGADDKRIVVDGKSIGAALEAIHHGGNDALDRIRKAELQKRELNKQITALQSELARVKSGAKDKRNITVYLSARQSGAVRISYQVDRAGWKPTYRASLDSNASTVELERLAVVSQKTGEDWSNVKLKLSTGQPRLSPQAPEPQPWLLTYHKPVPQGMPSGTRVASIPMAAPAPAPAIRNMAKGNSQEADDYIPPMVEVQNNFSTEFEVPTHVSLPADGREVSVALAKQNVPVKQRVRAVPRMEKSAVVTAEAARPAGVWLPGNIELFRDGSYVGASRWNTQASDKFVFSFGRDDLIRVAVDRAAEKSGSTGFLTQQNERKIADTYTITSTHKTAVDLLVLESSPVSTSDEIKVESTFDPKPTVDTWENKRGVVGWETQIAPNQSLKFHVNYTVAYPKEGWVSGLP